MGIIEVLAAIELVGGDQGAGLHLPEDGLHIDLCHSPEIDIYLCAAEFLG